MSTDVDLGRCPRCAAIVRPDSQWCTLCYADLRPAPPPLPVAAPAVAAVVNQAHVTVAAGGPAAHAAPSSDDLDPLTAPLALLERADREAPRGRHAAPDEATEPAASVGWPCLKCGELVSIDDSACPSCGAGFLESVHADSSLHRLGFHTGQVSNQARLLIMVGGSLGLLVLLVGLMYVVGLVF